MASATDSRYGQKESSDQNFDYMFKILIIGNSSVGKTSFLFRYADDSFTPAFVSTVGIDFKVKTIYRNDKRIKLQIWVSAGGRGWVGVGVGVRVRVGVGSGLGCPGAGRCGAVRPGAAVGSVLHSVPLGTPREAVLFLEPIGSAAVW